MALDGRLEGAEGNALDLAVDGKRKVGAVLRRADRLDVLDDVPEPILDHAAAAPASAERLLVGELESFLARVVHSGKADEMRRHFSGRIVTPVFALLVDPGKAQLRHGVRGFRRQ